MTKGLFPQPEFNRLQIKSVNQLKKGGWYLSMHRGKPMDIFQLIEGPPNHHNEHTLIIRYVLSEEPEVTYCGDRGITPYDRGVWNSWNYTVEITDKKLIAEIVNNPNGYLLSPLYTSFIEKVITNQNPEIVYPNLDAYDDDSLDLR